MSKKTNKNLFVFFETLFFFCCTPKKRLKEVRGRGRNSTFLPPHLGNKLKVSPEAPNAGPMYKYKSSSFASGRGGQHLYFTTTPPSKKRHARRVRHSWKNVFMWSRKEVEGAVLWGVGVGVLSCWAGWVG